MDLVTSDFGLVTSPAKSFWSACYAYCALISSPLTRHETEPLSEEARADVMAELDRILNSVPFRGSRRYPALLRYVVEKAAAGKTNDLKERLLGIEVFQRTPDYDTAADPVVRFSAGEVRRRLAQFYRENDGAKSVEIRFPVGSYVPEFVWMEAERSSPRPAEEMGLHEDGERASFVESGTAFERPHAISAPARTWRIRALWAFFAGVAIASLVFAAVHGWQMRQLARTPLVEVWAPLLVNGDRVVITVGRTVVQPGDGPETADSTIEEHIRRPESRVSFAAVEAIAQVAGFLKTQQQPFRLREALSTQLKELRGQPAIMVSGYNNNWTTRLLAPLRFRLAEQGANHYIEDAKNPARTEWNVDFNKPYLQQTADYAIVGRFYDSTTGGPVMIVAGISSNGTRAAGEFMVSPAAVKQLASLAPHGSLKQNFEAVLRVEVVGGDAGATTIVASDFW